VSEFRYLSDKRKTGVCRASLLASVVTGTLFLELGVAWTENKVITADKKASDGRRDV
jgi:hypothetical protein